MEILITGVLKLCWMYISILELYKTSLQIKSHLYIWSPKKKNVSEKQKILTNRQAQRDNVFMKVNKPFQTKEVFKIHFFGWRCMPHRVFHQRLLIYPMVEQSRRLLVQHFMRYEVLRARTFTQSDLPTGLQFSLIQIANAGFYNDIELGCIYCFDCGSELTDQRSLESAHGRGCNHEIQNVPLREMTRGLSQEEMVQYFSLFCSHSLSEHQRPLRNVSSAHDTSMGNIVMNPHLQSSASNIQDHRTTQAGVLNESLDLANISLIPNTEIVQEDIETTVAPPPGYSVPNEEALSVEEAVFVTQADQDVHANEVGVLECEQNSSYSPDYAISLDPPLDISSASYPQFASSEARRTSFTGWSHNNPQHPDELVACGFFYTGYTNCVRCFNCGLGLENWKPSDIPADQHALHKPNCAFNRMYRGQAYIDKAQQEQTQETTRSNVPTQSSQSEMTTQSSQSETTELSTLTLFPNRKEVLRSETHSEVREKLLAVKTEHDILKNRLRCLICSTRQVTCLFLPCRHIITCADCGWKETFCCKCKMLVKAHVLTYMS